MEKPIMFFLNFKFNYYLLNLTFYHKYLNNKGEYLNYFYIFAAKNISIN